MNIRLIFQLILDCIIAWFMIIYFLIGWWRIMRFGGQHADWTKMMSWWRIWWQERRGAAFWIAPEREKKALKDGNANHTSRRDRLLNVGTQLRESAAQPGEERLTVITKSSPSSSLPWQPLAVTSVVVTAVVVVRRRHPDVTVTLTTTARRSPSSYIRRQSMLHDVRYFVNVYDNKNIFKWRHGIDWCEYSENCWGRSLYPSSRNIHMLFTKYCSNVFTSIYHQSWQQCCPTVMLPFEIPS